MLAALCLAVVASPARAATYTWGNTGVTWSSSSNWFGATPGSADIALFNLNGTYTSQPAITAATSVGALWDTGSGALTVSGSALTLNGATVNGNAATGIEMDPGAAR